MQTEVNSTTRKSIVSAAEARTRSVNGKLAQLNDTIADILHKAVEAGETEATVHVADYSETVVTKAVASLREQGYKINTNRPSFGKASFASTIVVSWAE